MRDCAPLPSEVSWAEDRNVRMSPWKCLHLESIVRLCVSIAGDASAGARTGVYLSG